MCLQAEQDWGITSVLSACFVKHLTVDNALNMVEAIQPWVKDGTVTGLGCDSTELGNPREFRCVAALFCMR